MNYQNKNEDYYKHIRTDVVSLISKKQDCKILEIGAGLGATLSHLKTTGIAKEVVGLDISVDKDLKEWQGDERQLDDMLLIGLKI